MSRIGVYAGSFDPLTFGHTSVITRSLNIVDTLWILVATNPRKAAFFSEKERIDIINEWCEYYFSSHGKRPNILIGQLPSDVLLIEHAKALKASIIIRGLRNVSDFEYELNMSQANADINKDIITIFIPTKQSYSHISSSMVKEIANLGGNVKNYTTLYCASLFERKRIGGK